MFNIFWKQKVKTEVNPFTTTILLVGLFPSFIAMLFLGQKTFVKVDTVFNTVMVSGAAVLALHLPFLKKLNRFFAEIAAYCIIGWGMIITCLLMTLNYAGHSAPVTTVYAIARVTAHPDDREPPFPVSVTFDKETAAAATPPPGIYDDFSYLLKFEGEDELKYKDKPREAVMTTAEGFFGYRILLRKELR